VTVAVNVTFWPTREVFDGDDEVTATVTSDRTTD